MRAVLVLSMLVLGSCASGYGEFYKGVQGATPEAIARDRVGPPPKIPTLDHARGQSADMVSAYARAGYALIGYSSFNSGRRESDSSALSQGATVGADLVVVIDPTYTGSIATSIPITTPTSTTSYSTGSATAYGSGGSATAFGNSTTTTYGTQTTYLPMVIQRFDYGALYFIKRHYVLGANFRDLNDEERRALQSNKGVYIVAIVDGSPAYKGDMLTGDTIVAIDGQPVYGIQGCTDLLQQRRGHTVEITIVRSGQTISKSIALAE